MQEKVLANEVARRLRGLLEFRGVSIKAFAEATGIPYKTFQAYLSAAHLPGARHLAAIAGESIDINWLLTGDLRHPLMITGTLQNERAEELGADLQFVDALMDRSLILADEYSKRWQTSDQKALSASEHLRIVAFYFLRMIQLGAKMVPHLKQLRSDGVPMDELVSILEVAITPDLDPAIERTILGANS